MSRSGKKNREHGDVEVRPAVDSGRPLWRDFPGPRSADAPLRVAIDRNAHAELIAHAMGSLTAEVGGVLVGLVGEDERGLFVQVRAIIRASGAAEASTHVTFTQKTWDEIHATLERDHPKDRIVGWYHTHPGFGVEFSEMDVFIQQNFFSGPTQIALVTDPANGAVAIAMSGEDGITYLPRYWVDGREQEARTPAARPGGTAGGETIPSDVAQVVKALETRVNQLVQSHDDLRTLFQQVVLTVGMIFCLAILGTGGYLIYSSYYSRLDPPRGITALPLPLRIGGKDLMLGLAIIGWDIPPELNSLLLQAEERQRAAAAKAAEKAAKQMAPANDPPPKSEPAHD
jgi:proteasome lid subunit RPN8/RPN11